MTIDFNDYFWGEKNNGFDVLYHNMKSATTASKELSDFFREKSNIEENNSKLMAKLANKAGSGCTHGTFSPVWVVLKTSAERLSSLHLQMVQKLSELVKDVAKYAEDVHKKHKVVKEEESGTLDAVQLMQTSTVAVHKARDLHMNRLLELEKLRKENGSSKDIEKMEAKLRKLHDDYKVLLEKHNPVKSEFERRMTTTCKRFQDIEESHLKQMKEFLSTYIELLQNNHDMVGQVHSDFKRQFVELTVDKLLEQFVLSKYTGLEKPEIASLELNTPPTTGNSSQQSSTPLFTTKTTVNTNEQESDKDIIVEDIDLLASSAVPTTATKREYNIRNWFSLSSSSPSTGNEFVNKRSGNNSQYNDAEKNDDKKAKDDVTNIDDINSNPNSPSQSMNIYDKITKRKIGDNLYNSRTEETGPQAYQGVEQLAHQEQPTQQQQKSSRRTTSLLNLFMSNSQGSREDRSGYNSYSHESASVEAISTTSGNDQNSNIGRNALRASKFSAILRSGRSKTKIKKTKKMKDLLDLASGTKDDKPALDDDENNKKSTDQATPVSNTSLSNVVLSGVPVSSTPVSSNSATLAPTATPEIDEDGYSVQPKDSLWEAQTAKKEEFYSDSDSDSEHDERERKIHVEIKPLNGTAPISASVDELRATVENLALSPLGGALSIRQGFNCESEAHNNMKRSQSVSQQIGNKPSNDLLGLNLLQQHQSPGASNASTPTTSHPYAPLQSPTLSVSNTCRYADIGDIFSEVGEISASAPASANLGRLGGRQIPTPTSAGGSSIAIPRPPSRRSEAAARGRISPSTISRADSVGSLEFRTASIGIGSSRGPSPLTIGKNDMVPLAVAFHEIVHAFFKGSDESKCQCKMSGDMMLSFPAGIVSVLANNPTPAKLGFCIKNTMNLENVIPNKQLVTIDKLQSTSTTTILDFNMLALTSLLRRQSEQNPTASYFNVDILKYQIKSKLGAASCPFQLVAYWKCEPTHTDIKIDYKYNSHAMATTSPLLNLTISVPVDGGVKNVQSKPHSAWMGESNRLVWNFTDISQHSDNNGVGTLRARLEVGAGPSNPAVISTQFNCEGTTLSGIEFELMGTGYRLSLVKRRFVSGKYICEGDGIRNTPTPTPPIANSPNPSNYSR